MPEEVKTWKQRWGPWIAWLAGCLMSAIVGGLTGVSITPPPPPKVVEVDRPVVVADPDATPPQYGDGWVNDPEQVAAVVAQLPIKTFAATPAGQVVTIPKAVYLWKAYEQLFARGPPLKDQGQVGSCVSFGTNTAIERTLAAEIVAGRRFDWTAFVEEATYGGSRVEIGGGRIRGDGSVGAWASEWWRKYGGVPRKRYDSIDLTSYSESLCRKWGQSGVPDEFERIAREYPIQDTTQVRTWEEAKTALASGYSTAICSSVGFHPQRDANGVARADRRWAHCMCLDGYHTDDRSREYGHIVNSWGKNYHRGPVGWGSPGEDGFWADADTIDRMLRQGDSWAFSGVSGFPRRRLPDWFIVVPRVRDPLARFLDRPEVTLAW